MGLHDRVATGEALQTDLRKLPRTCWPKLEVGGGAHQSADQWIPPLATSFGQEASWWVPMVSPGV